MSLTRSIASAVHALPLLLLLTLPLGTVAGRGFSEQQLFSAYLAGDMEPWRKYIDSTDWKTASLAERERIVGYEYGFVAAELERDAKSGERYLRQYQAHVEALQPKLPPARYCTYLSAAYAYHFQLDNTKIFSCALRAYRLAHQAVEHDPLDPLAVTLVGNVDFYSPTALGGDKKRALDMFARAEALMRTDTTYRLRWNYPATMLCMAQCREKTGDLRGAIATCRHILALYPDFVFVRDTYLPELLRQLHKP